MTKSFEQAEAVLHQVVEKITPAVLEMAARKDSGCIQIHFGSGEFKLATKQASL